MTAPGWISRNREKHAAYNKQWYHKNRERILAASRAKYCATREREKVLMYRYGLTPEEVDRMRALQGDLCAICGCCFPPGRQPAVDHDHETLKVRGLLCLNCNRDLGVVEKRGAAWLGAAIEYLERWK